MSIHQLRVAALLNLLLGTTGCRLAEVVSEGESAPVLEYWADFEDRVTVSQAEGEFACESVGDLAAIVASLNFGKGAAEVMRSGGVVALSDDIQLPCRLMSDSGSSPCGAARVSGERLATTVIAWDLRDQCRVGTQPFGGPRPGRVWLERWGSQLRVTLGSGTFAVGAVGTR
jgi:hypothetical protein